MEYLRYVIYAAVLAEAVLLIMPSGTMKKYVKICTGVSIMIILLTPVCSCHPTDLLRDINEETAVVSQKNAGSMITQSYNDMLKNNN